MPHPPIRGSPPHTALAPNHLTHAKDTDQTGKPAAPEPGDLHAAKRLTDAAAVRAESAIWHYSPIRIGSAAIAAAK